MVNWHHHHFVSTHATWKWPDPGRCGVYKVEEDRIIVKQTNGISKFFYLSDEGGHEDV
ncbi:MAG: hypothetical protein IPJ13_20530 [Saprospiraceae bacterium]|nr:hypothetical protein [Saprospiraceae bacterium]